MDFHFKALKCVFSIQKAKHGDNFSFSVHGTEFVHLSIPMLRQGCQHQTTAQRGSCTP